MGWLEQLPPGMGGMLMMLPAMYIMNKIDFTDADNLLYLRVGFCVAQAATFAICVYMFFRIRAAANQTKVTVPPKQFDTTGQPTVMTIEAYDTSELKKIFSQLLMGFVLTGFFHLKWEITAPLFLQIFITPKNALTSPLFKTAVMGEVLTRPFPEAPNPLADLFMGGQKPAAKPVAKAKKTK